MHDDDWKYAQAHRRVTWRTIAALAGTAVALLAVIAFAVGPAFGAWRITPILSGSMRPDLAVGSLAIATPEFVSDVHPGQVIVFRTPVGDHLTVAHRVIQVIQGGAEPIVQTKGDANAAPDPFRAQLHGNEVWVVRGSVPLLGYAALAAARGRMLIAALLTAVLLIPVAVFLARSDLSASGHRLRRARQP